MRKNMTVLTPLGERVYAATVALLCVGAAYALVHIMARVVVFTAQLLGTI